MPTAFITGITGQDGAYLARFLLARGYVVHGGMRRVSQPRLARLERLGIADRVHLHECDLLDLASIQRVLRDLRPDELYNLAAQSHVATSWEVPSLTARVNALAVGDILETLRLFSPETRFYQASTSEMFGNAGGALDESAPLRPRSPYGAAKAHAHHLTVNYRESWGMHLSSGILFNHESPLRGEEFVTRKITRGLARIAHGAGGPVLLGNLDARRDWGFAGDHVAAMWQMLQRDRGGDYVVATGVATSVRDFARLAAGALGFTPETLGEGLDETAVDRKTGRCLWRVTPGLFRPAEIDRLCGDAARARRDLGWTPATGIEALADMMARADHDALA
ncbi:MAG: GDP-mannose 4,6-dehydratase [Rubellimicrobium sp.]|nr:GDP-mannose 4,6-dehydratase [Rubellimicrobium sp.]